ncbi:MAG TPA: hypothetical protein VFK36_10840 [Gemmatimonadales bacterium]|nr:hypothetical protein [Gemmatimonadales bacterium]
MRELLWVLEAPTPLRCYAAELLTEWIGLRARILPAVPDGQTPCVLHGLDWSGSAPRLRIPNRPDSVPATAVTWQWAGRAGELSADIVNGTAALLTDEPNRALPDDAYDRHGRLWGCRSTAGLDGVADPLINRYAAALRAALPALGAYEAEPTWPVGYTACVALSHDVDRPDKYAGWRALRRGRLPAPRLVPWFAARAGYELVQRGRDTRPEEFWLFDDILQFEAEAGVRSTFLFAVMPAYGAYGSRHDVLYDAAWPDVSGAARGIVQAGWEVGLHASYNAYQRASRFAEEKQRLESLAGVPARGLRHHFWHVGPDVAATLRAHEDAGFQYDSSLAFNDVVGLRRGIALPYRPWDSARQRPLKTWQLPVLALDSAACGGRSVEEAVEHVWRALEGILAVGGLAALDWHVRCSLPLTRRYAAWGTIYQSLVERLAARSDVWVTNLGAVAEWAQRRVDRIRLSPRTGPFVAG